MPSMIDADMIIAANPCKDWPNDRVREAVPEPVDFVTLMHDDRIPVADRIWGACKVGVIPDRELRLFACECAERDLARLRKAGHEPDHRSVAAVEVARRCADGLATWTDLSEARYYALAAYHGTETSIGAHVALTAASACHDSSHREAAYHAASEARSTVICSSLARWSFALYTEERDWQIRLLCEIVTCLD